MGAMETGVKCKNSENTFLKNALKQLLSLKRTLSELHSYCDEYKQINKAAQKVVVLNYSCKLKDYIENIKLTVDNVHTTYLSDYDSYKNSVNNVQTVKDTTNSINTTVAALEDNLKSNSDTEQVSDHTDNEIIEKVCNGISHKNDDSKTSVNQDSVAESELLGLENEDQLKTVKLQNKQNKKKNEIQKEEDIKKITIVSDDEVDDVLIKEKESKNRERNVDDAKDADSDGEKTSNSDSGGNTVKKKQKDAGKVTQSSVTSDSELSESDNTKKKQSKVDKSKKLQSVDKVLDEDDKVSELSDTESHSSINKVADKTEEQKDENEIEADTNKSINVEKEKSDKQSSNLDKHESSGKKETKTARINILIIANNEEDLNENIEEKNKSENKSKKKNTEDTDESSDLVSEEETKKVKADSANKKINNIDKEKNTKSSDSEIGTNSDSEIGDKTEKNKKKLTKDTSKPNTENVSKPEDHVEEISSDDNNDEINDVGGSIDHSSISDSSSSDGKNISKKKQSQKESKKDEEKSKKLTDDSGTENEKNIKSHKRKHKSSSGESSDTSVKKQSKQNKKGSDSSDTDNGKENKTKKSDQQKQKNKDLETEKLEKNKERKSKATNNNNKVSSAESSDTDVEKTKKKSRNKNKRNSDTSNDEEDKSQENSLEKTADKESDMKEKDEIKEENEEKPEEKKTFILKCIDINKLLDPKVKAQQNEEDKKPKPVNASKESIIVLSSSSSDEKTVKSSKNSAKQEKSKRETEKQEKSKKETNKKSRRERDSSSEPELFSSRTRARNSNKKGSPIKEKFERLRQMRNQRSARIKKVNFKETSSDSDSSSSDTDSSDWSDKKHRKSRRRNKRSSSSSEDSNSRKRNSKNKKKRSSSSSSSSSSDSESSKTKDVQEKSIAIKICTDLPPDFKNDIKFRSPCVVSLARYTNEELVKNYLEEVEEKEIASLTNTKSLKRTRKTHSSSSSDTSSSSKLKKAKKPKKKIKKTTEDSDVSLNSDSDKDKLSDIVREISAAANNAPSPNLFSSDDEPNILSDIEKNGEDEEKSKKKKKEKVETEKSEEKKEEGKDITKENDKNGEKKDTDNDEKKDTDTDEKKDTDTDEKKDTDTDEKKEEKTEKKKSKEKDKKDKNKKDETDSEKDSKKKSGSASSSGDNKSDDDKPKKKEKSKWRNDKLLRTKVDSTDSEEELIRYRNKKKKLDEKNGSGTEDEVVRTKSSSKKSSKSRGRRLGSESNKSSDSENSSGDLFETKKKKKSSDSADSSDSEVEKKKKVRKRIKKLKDSEDSSDEKSKDKSTRKKIRDVWNRDSLADTTKAAAKEEEERKRRISERQKLYNQIYEISGDHNAKVEKVVLDFNDETKEELLSVDPELCTKLKPHQAKGVQFMWTACFESLERTKKTEGSGCILAHCMGLGKTLQVITLIHTLITNSEKTGVKTVLVVCPLSTVLNWVNEFKKWLDELDGEEINIFELVSYKQIRQRLFVAKDWQKYGGVLVIGYDMFRNFATGRRQPKKITAGFNTCLIDPGPDLVICDEGHLLKNEKTGISIAMNKLKTLRRIVLTGTPLQNNLKEYYCMVQFVKPNLLGTYREYLNRFVNPITNGQYTDSTDRDISIMRRRSHVLHKMLDGVVQRRDYSVLAPFLPPKHEYVLFITLTKIQTELYKEYLAKFARNNSDSKGMSYLFNDFQELQRICIHPRVLLDKSIQDKLRKEKEDDDEDEEGSLKDFIDDDDSEKSTSAGSSSSDGDKSDKSSVKSVKVSRRTRANPGNIEESEPEAEPAHEEWWSKFITGDELDNINHSSKILLLFEILHQCELIGDKVLVFSQSLYSLNLIEYFLDKIEESTQKNEKSELLGNYQGSWARGLDYFRLDGSTSCDKRNQWCKLFNSEENTRARLFLISTKAGGLGINLIAANRVIIFDVSWNPSHDIQSIYRVYRFGQIKPCYIYRFVTFGTMENKIYERQVTKQAISKRVIDEQQIDRHYNQNDLAELYAFTGDPEEERPIPMVPKDRLFADLLQSHDKNIYKYHEHNSLLENKEDETLNEEERKAAWEEFENEKKAPQKFDIMQAMMNNGMYDTLKVLLEKDNPAYTPLQINQLLPTAIQMINQQVSQGDFRMYQRILEEHRRRLQEKKNMELQYQYMQQMNAGYFNPGMLQTYLKNMQPNPQVATNQPGSAQSSGVYPNPFAQMAAATANIIKAASKQRQEVVEIDD